jgi:hypothetical protein
MKRDPSGLRRGGGCPACGRHQGSSPCRCNYVAGSTLMIAGLWPANCLVILLSLFLNSMPARAQSPDVGWEGRPKLQADIELLPRTRLQAWGELQDGIDFSFQRWRTGFLLNRRMRPISKQHRQNIDAEKEHHLVFGAGYEYLHTIQNGSLKIENRIITQLTPNYLAPGNILITDRNRVEYRWVNGAYDVRYRNKLMVQHIFEFHSFQVAPYGSGELYYDRNHQAWNQNQYGGGVQFPYKKMLMVDTYLLHQNCSSCSQNSINMLGLTLNLYFRQPK